MNSYFMNNASNSVSVHNSIVAGMSLGTVVNMKGLPRAKSASNCVELVKSVNHWLTDSILTDAPIIQSPSDHTKEHPALNQPAGIDHSVCDEIESLIKTQEKKQKFRGVMYMLDRHLENATERKSYESENFGVSIIQEKHLGSIPEAKRKDHSTLGIRGAIANRDIKVGSPLIYSAQYRVADQWLDAIEMLAVHLSQEFDLSAKDAFLDAKSRLNSCSFLATDFQSERYRLSAYGSGNIGAMLNHDDEFFNMIPFNPKLLDSNGNPVIDIPVLYACRDIEKGEQLLFDYGKDYDFDTFIESTQEVKF